MNNINLEIYYNNKLIYSLNIYDSLLEYRSKDPMVILGYEHCLSFIKYKIGLDLSEYTLSEFLISSDGFKIKIRQSDLYLIRALKVKSLGL